MTISEYPQFVGSENIFSDQEQSKIVLLPVPYDRTSTWIKGADKGPLALLEASGHIELYDIETDSEVYTRGIHTLPALQVEDFSPDEMVNTVEEKVHELLASGKFVITLGGEHSVSIGSVRAHSKKIKDMCVIQLDAHADLRDEYEGSQYNHACVMRRIKEECPIVQVGIRSVCSLEKKELGEKRVFYAKDIYDNNHWIEEVLKVASDNIYVSIDLDVFDPSIMPSTGTPHPGGLGWYQVLELLKTLSGEKNIIGFDVVELCPAEGNKAPDLLAAELVYKFLSYIYCEK